MTGSIQTVTIPESGGGGTTFTLSVGSAITGGTDGSILFIDAGAIAENNSGLFWDETNERLGIGTATPEAQFHIKNTENEAGDSFIFEATGTVGTTPAKMVFLHGGSEFGTSGVRGVSFTPLGTDSRTQLVLLANGGSFIRMGNDTGGSVPLQFGTASNSIANRPAYFKTNNVKHFLFRPGSSKQVWIADKDEGSNLGNPSAMLHIENNSDTVRGILMKGHWNQGQALLEFQDSNGNVLSYHDKRGDLVLRSYTNSSRPSAGVAGKVIFNTDDGQLNIDDGTNWTLPDGTTT